MPSIPTTKAYAEWWADYVFKNFPKLEVVKSVEVEEMTQHKFITHWYHVKEKQSAPHPADLPGQTLMFQDSQ